MKLVNLSNTIMGFQELRISMLHSHNALNCSLYLALSLRCFEILFSAYMKKAFTQITEYTFNAYSGIYMLMLTGSQIVNIPSENLFGSSFRK